MNRLELYRRVATKASTDNVKFAKKDIEAVLNAYGDVVLEYLSEVKDTKEKVPAPGLGNWRVKVVPAREGVSKLHGEKKWKTEEHTVLHMQISPKSKKFQ